MSDARSIIQAAVRGDRQRRMGLRVGTVTSTSNGESTVNFGRSQGVRVPTGSAEVAEGQSMIVLEMDGLLLPMGSAPIVIGSTPEVEVIP